MFFTILIWSFFSAFSDATALPNNASIIDTSIQGWCAHLAKELRSVDLNRCLARDWKIDSFSTEGRPIPHLFWGVSERVQPLPGQQPTPAITTSSVPGKKILILATIHGDEISAVSVVFRWMDFLERTKPDSFLRSNRYLFLPLANPDGFYANPRTRTNKNKVD